MKTDKNSQTLTSSGTLLQTEQAFPDTNPYRIIHGDALQELRKLPDASVDLVLTDPPYLVRYKDRSGRTVANDDNSRWLFPAFSELFRVLKPNSYCVSFYGWLQADRFLSIWRECGFQPVGHFVFVKHYASCVRHNRMQHEQAYLLAKGNPLPPQRPPADVLPWQYTGNKLHPTQKPVGSLTPLIEAYSRPNGLVLDPFAGSGSTGVAALSYRRRCLLIEKEAAYYQIAQRRLDNLPYHITHPYVDNDPEVVRVSRNLLHETDNVRVIQQDLKFIKVWLKPDRFQNIDITKPVGILLVAVLHFVTNDSEVGDILSFLKARLAPGSFLVISHSTSDGRTQEVMQSLVANYKRQVNDVKLRSNAEIAALVQGFELIEPGLVPISNWKPQLPDMLVGKPVDTENSRLLACVAEI